METPLDKIVRLYPAPAEGAETAYKLILAGEMLQDKWAVGLYIDYKRGPKYNRYRDNKTGRFVSREEGLKRLSDSELSVLPRQRN